MSRRQRRPRRQALKHHLAHIPWRNIQNPAPPVERLSPEQVEQIHNASMQILEETGILFMDAETLDMWEKAGADVDHTSQNVKIDRGLLLELISHAPAEWTWRARNPAHNVQIGSNHIMFMPNGGVVFANDLERGRRPGTMNDYIKAHKLLQMCNVIHTAGTELIVPHDVEVAYRHLERSFSSYMHTDKIYMEAPHGRIISDDAVKMAQIMFGDDIVDSDQPVLGGIVNSSSPLRYDDRMIGGILTFARAKQVLIITPFILAGAMSPITMAAAIAQQNAEALAGVALAQLARPGAPVIYGGFATNIDMKTGAPAMGTPEGAWAMLVGAQMARRYNLPFRGTGTLNTSKVADAQAAYETAWSIWPAVMGHANVVVHSIGWLESGLTVGAEKMIIDMENLAMFQHFLQPVEISDDTLALDMIHEVGAGGHHLGTAHTQTRFDTEFYQPFLFDRLNFKTWEYAGAEDAATRAHRIWKELLRSYEPPAKDPTISEALADFVARRKRELVGVSLYT